MVFFYVVLVVLIVLRIGDGFYVLGFYIVMIEWIRLLCLIFVLMCVMDG